MATLLIYALTTVQDVKENLGIDSGDTSKDNLITRRINQATQMIESFCNLSYNHHFIDTTYIDEEYDGQGTDTISLQMRPVSTVTRLQGRTTSQNSDDWDTIDTERYFVDEAAGVLELLFTQTSGWNRYRVTYTAGYTEVPADLSEAAATIASFYIDNSASGTAVKRKTEGQRSIEYFDPSGSSSGGSDSIIAQLGLDDVLQRYIQYNLADTK